MEVDHITPRIKGGRDEISNLQALCYQCNAMKRDRDDTDFRQVVASYRHREAGCLFCELPTDRLVLENRLAVAILAGESISPENTKWHAPQRYADIQTSNLTVTITGPTNDLKIELKSDGGKSVERKDREGGTENSGFQFGK